MVGLEELGASRAWIELAVRSIELFGVAVIVVSLAVAAFRFVRGVLRRPNAERGEALAEEMKRRIGRALLIGLEILVAADIVQTVALDPTLESIAGLGLLVIVRTFLSWSIILEIEGRWPWKKASPSEQGPGEPAGAESPG
jgi:uncharacterized membrane protein